MIAACTWNATAGAAATVPDWLLPITLTAEPFIGVTHYQTTQPAGWSSPILPRPLAIHLVVDGRQGSFSQGMRTDEMAEFLRAFGVDNAINLDGGGSSTLVFGDGLNGVARTINSPSDGSTERVPGGERAVANQFWSLRTPNPAYVPLASPPRPGDPASDPRLKTLTLLDVFEHTEGRFRSSPTASDSNRGIAAASVELSSEAAQGATSEKITVVRDNSASGRLRFLSADGNPTGNRVPVSGQLHAMGVTGHVGFFMKTLDPGLKVSLAVDDGYSSAVSGTEISVARDVIADGQWHLYQ